jgi:hypothetical protein
MKEGKLYILSPEGQRPQGASLMTYWWERMGYYAKFNIILVDTLDAIYAYELNLKCGTGLDELRAPVFLRLQPEDIYLVKNISSLKRRFENGEVNQNNVVISVNRDTIRDTRFYELRSFLKEEMEGLPSMRRMTEEEEIVLDAKLRRIEYDPNNYSWKKTYKE